MLFTALPLTAFAAETGEAPASGMDIQVDEEWADMFFAFLSEIDNMPPPPAFMPFSVPNSSFISWSEMSVSGWSFNGQNIPYWPSITLLNGGNNYLMAACAALDFQKPSDTAPYSRTGSADNMSLRILVAGHKGGFDGASIQAALWSVNGGSSSLLSFANAQAVMNAANALTPADLQGYTAYRWAAGSGIQPIFSLHFDSEPPEPGENDKETRIVIETRVEVETTTTIENGIRYSEAWGQITIRKENQNHESLDGAQFDIQLAFANGEVRNIRNWEVDNGARLLTWQHPAGDISPVQVTVTEVRPPQHYSLDPTPQVATVAPTYTTFFIQTTRMWTTEMSFHYHLVFHIGGGGDDDCDDAPAGASSISADGWQWIQANVDASDNDGDACPICSHEFGPVHNSTQVGSDTQETASMTVGDRETTLTFRNVRERGQLIITKLCSVTSQPLAGAEFRVEGVDLGNAGSFSQTVTTGADGTVTINGLFPGSYRVTEIGAPPTHNNDAPPQTFAVQSNELVRLTFRNTRRQGLQILKVDPEGNALQGAVFQVARGSGQSLGSFITDVNGLIIIPSNQLVTGEYVVTEIQAPDGFLIDHANNPQRIFVDNTQQNQNYQLTFRNFRMPSIEVIKVDASDPTIRLEGAVFRISNTMTGQRFEGTTDANGRIYFPRLDLNTTYIIEEVSAPAGHVNSGFRQEIVLRENRVHTVIVTNSQKPSLTIVKVDDVTGERLAGATFRLRAENGSFHDATTDTNGTAIITDLEPGVYTLVEIQAPSGYIHDSTNSRTITVREGQHNEIRISNQKYPTLTLRKVDSVTESPVAGARFLIERLTFSGIVRVGEFTSNAAGLIVFPQIAPGRYRITEIEAPAGFVIDRAVHEITIESGDNELVITNTPRSPIFIRKTDPQGNPLFGAEFTVRQMNGGMIGRFTTSHTGYVLVPNVEPGWYIVEEVRAPDGFVLNNTPQNVQLIEGRPATVTFVNQRRPTLQIVKIDEITGRPLAGAVFRLAETSGRFIGDFTSDNDGLAIIHDLAPGGYVLVETRAPDGYLRNSTPRTIHLEAGRVHREEFRNTPLHFIRIIKKDAVDGSLLAGATFRLLDERQQEIERGTTNRAGELIFSGLVPGRYFIEELRAPDGYLRSDEIRRIDLHGDRSLEIPWENTPLRDISVIKTCADSGDILAGAVFRLLDSRRNEITRATTGADGVVRFAQLAPGRYFIEEVTAPSGYLRSTEIRQIDLTANADFETEWKNTPLRDIIIIKTDADNGNVLAGAVFRLLDSRRNELSRATSGPDGVARFEQLAPGRYFIEEVTAPGGYLRSTEIRQIDLTANADIEIEWENMPLRDIIIVKVDNESGELLAGAVFRLLDSRRNELARATSGPDGEARFERLAPGRYFIEEVTAPRGYVRRAELMQIDLTSNQNLIITWENQRILGSIEIVKLSDADHPETGTPKGSRLAGAVFEILDGNMERVDRITTDRNGWARSRGLVPGRYAIREIRSPSGYILNGAVFYAEIRNHGDVIRFEVLNEPEDINITVTKRGNEEAVAGDVIRYDFSNVKNDSNIPLHDFYFRDNLPPEVILQSVHIPAWTHRLTYRVVYTTNQKQNPQIWRAGLHTANSYELSVADLGLAASEFITSFRLEFGTVPAGFTQDGDFYMYTLVRENLPHEHRFVNRVDVGGRSRPGGDWHYARDSWAVVVFSKPRGPLPRTGLIVCENQDFSFFDSALLRTYSAASSLSAYRTLMPPQSGQALGSLLLSKQKRHLQIKTSTASHPQ